MGDCFSHMLVFILNRYHQLYHIILKHFKTSAITASFSEGLWAAWHFRALAIFFIYGLNAHKMDEIQKALNEGKYE